MISRELFDTLVYIWIGIALVLFPVQLKITAPYGRHSKSNWGPMLNNRLGWFVMESPALFVFLLLVITRIQDANNIVLVFVLMWILHYFHRVVLFPFRIKTEGKKMPVVIMLFAFFFNLVNGFLNGYWFGHFGGTYADNWSADPRFYSGIFLFFLGFLINQYHDRILIRLRENTPSGYVIPKGGLFSYVSCPNFLGEIIEWGGFALMTWCLPTFSFFIWTLANLIPRAIDHHKWYLKNFKDYPSGRKAVLPFLV